MRDSTGPRRAPTSIADGVALGAYRALRAGPSGAERLGEAFIAAQGGDLAGAIGQLLIRVERLERRVGECRRS